MSRKTKVLLIALGLILIGFFFILEKDGSDIQSSNNTSKDNEERVEEKEDSSKEEVEREIDRKSPDFKLENLSGEEVSLSDYRGKIVFLNFWATWCGFCDEEMPYFQNMVDNNEDLVVLAVNVQESEKVVKKYIEDGGYTFPVLLDTEGNIGGEYLVGALPTTYLIDKEGNLLDRIPSMLTQDQMEEVLIAIRKLEEKN